MKAITLRQPWASLIAIGVKRFETRSWATGYRGTLAIHAARRRADPREWEPEINAALAAAGYGWYGDALPYSCVLCTVKLAAIYRTGHELGHEPIAAFTDRDRPFGDFTPGLFAWHLIDITPMADYITARGEHGLWEWSGA